MNDDALELIKESIICAQDFSTMIKNYLIENKHNCNVTQIFILHSLIQLGGSSPIFKIEKEMQFISKNSSYNIQNLANDGYISKERIKYEREDARYGFATITKKGRQLHQDVCDFTMSRISKILNRGWTEDTFQDYIKKIEDLRFIAR